MQKPSQHHSLVALKHSQRILRQRDEKRKLIFRVSGLNWKNIYNTANDWCCVIVKRFTTQSCPNGAPRSPEIQKNAVIWDPYFLIRHTPRITEIPIWKYFMCILARNFDISDLCTEKMTRIWQKKGHLQHIIDTSCTLWLKTLKINDTFWLFRFNRYV